MKRLAFAVVLLCLCGCLSGCGSGQEIESCLFVLSMAVDPAPDGNLTVTVKALSGTQDAAGPVSGSSSEKNSGESPDKSPAGAQNGKTETPEPGYIVLSATAKSCLRALNLLSSTTPRTVNLSQLREVVLNETLARTDATLSILKEIYSMYRANGEAIVVVTPDDAGDFIRRQRAILGVRLSKYLEVLFEHFSGMDTIPPAAQLSAVIAAMQSTTADAAAVYAAGNAFDSTLVLAGASDTDRLPGHLPRTSPAENEYLGCALFSGPRMTGTLTGEETGVLCLLMGRAQRQTAFIGDAQYRVNVKTRVRRAIDRMDGALSVQIDMSLTRIAGESDELPQEIAAQIERRCADVMMKIKAAACDAAGFGRIAVRRYRDIPAWEAAGWKQRYESAPVRVRVRVKVL